MVSFLFGGKKSQAAQTPAVAGLQIQSSAYGAVVPICYGTNRMAPNLIWYNDFVAKQQSSSGGGGGGKGGIGGGGGGKGGGGSVSYTYSTAVALGLCEGPIISVPTAYVDKNVTTPAALGLSVFLGSYSQSPWSYLTTAHPSQALNYHGIAYLAASSYQLGNSPQLPNHNFVLAAVYSNSIVINAVTMPDADPSLVVVDYTTNSHYGAGFPAGLWDDLSVYQAYCIANGLWISPFLTDQTQASSLLDDIALATNSAFVWSSGKLKLVPYGDQSITNNGYTYTAPSAPLYDLTDDDFMINTNSSSGFNTDPVQCTRTLPADALNSIKIEAVDRNNAYNPAVVEAKDTALIQIFGLRQQPSKQLHLFADLKAAQLSAQLQLQRQAIRNIYSFQLDQRYVLLDPMDIVTLTDARLGLNKQWVRIREITENDDRSLSFIAEEYLNGTGSAPVYSFQNGAGFGANYNADPGSVNSPVIFEPTDALAGALEVWLVVSGVNLSLWGGCDVWLSTDNSSYALQGRITGESRQGVLSTSLPSITAAAVGNTIDSTNTLSVDLTESGGVLTSGSQSDALNLSTLCYVDGELLAYQTANLTATSKYDLTFLVRGAYDTTISSHAAGSQFARLDNSIFKIPFSADFIGKTIYVKFVSFNIYGGGQQSIADLQPFAYTIQGTAFTSPLPNVTGFATAYIAGLTTLIWNPVSDFRPVDYEIRLGDTWNSAQIIGRTPILQSAILGDGKYWIAAHFTVPNGGQDIYSETPVDLMITGSQLTQNVIASYDELATGWLGTFDHTIITTLLSANNLVLTGSGDITAIPDITVVPDIVFYGGVAASGTYTVPTAHRINIGRVDTCQVIMKLGSVVGYNTNSVDITTIADITLSTDVLGISLGGRVNAIPQIRLSQDGVTFADWQNWIPGSYTAMLYDARVMLTSADPSVVAILTDLTFTVDVPDLIVTGTNIALLAGGSPITFAAPFNGGPNGATVPNIQVTILSASAGDDVILSAVSLSGFTVQVVNGGVGVVRSVNYTAQGY